MTSSEEVKDSVSMKSLDSSRGEHYKSKLEEFRSKHVNEDNFEDYVQEVDSFIENVREIISDELDDRSSKAEKKESLIEEIGEDRLDNIRDRGPGKWSFDILQVSNVDRDLKEKNWKLFELAWFLFQNTWVEKKKLEGVLREVDTQGIQSRYFEKHEEMIEKDREMTRKQFQNLVEGLRKVEDNRNQSLKMLAESVEKMAEVVTQNQKTGSFNVEGSQDESIDDDLDVEECMYCKDKYLVDNLDEHQNNCSQVKEKVKDIIEEKIENDEDVKVTRLAEEHPRGKSTISNWYNELKDDG